MKTNVRAISIDAFYEHINSGDAYPQWVTILKFIETHPGCTRRQIKDGTDIEINAVTGRVNSLVEARLVEEDPDPVRDPKTKKWVTTLRLARREERNQMDMFGVAA